MLRSMFVLLALLTASPVLAQTERAGESDSAIKPEGDWIGFIEAHDSRGLLLLPVLAHLAFAPGIVNGRWVMLSAKQTHAGGDITGTVDQDGKFRVTITMAGAAEQDGQTVAIERCAGKAVFTGTFLKSGTFRWTASRMPFDTPVKRIQNQHCEDMLKLTVMLQPMPDR